jgi:hypothetical protein
MATDRQIAANRKNAERSTGPSPEALARTRFNATRHGLASTLPAVEAEFSPEFEDRRACWSAEQAPLDEEARYALDRAVAASLRIERCEKAIDGLIADSRQRAELAWDEDRAAEAAVIYSRLARNPTLVSKQLRTTLAGAELMMEAWLGLTSALRFGRDWNEIEASMALDLLGIDPNLRAAPTMIDPPDDHDPIAFRLDLAKNQFASLELLRDHALIPLEEVDRRRALAGDLALQSKPMQQLLRYERDAWRRYRESTRERKTKAATPLEARSIAAKPQKPPEPPKSPARPSFEDERRALMAEVAPIRDAMIEELVALGFEDEDAWIEELERRSARFASRSGDFIPVSAGRSATERSQFGGVAVG